MMLDVVLVLCLLYSTFVALCFLVWLGPKVLTLGGGLADVAFNHCQSFRWDYRKWKLAKARQKRGPYTVLLHTESYGEITVANVAQFCLAAVTFYIVLVLTMSLKIWS